MENLSGVLCESCDSQMKKWNIEKRTALFTCPKCGHITRFVDPEDGNLRKHAWGGDALFDKIRAWLTFRKINKTINPENDDKILEIGFGSGRLLVKFGNKGCFTHGADADYLEAALLPPLKNNKNIFRQKIETIDFPKNYFDMIYAIHVIEHIDYPKLVFQKCFESLKPGGSIFFITPNAESYGLKIFKSAWWNLEDPTHVRFFSKVSISKMLNDSGFREVKVEKPIWDSLTLEVNSLMRVFKKDNSKHGVMSGIFVKITDAFLFPLFLGARILVPKLSPSIVIIAKK